MLLPSDPLQEHLHALYEDLSTHIVELSVTLAKERVVGLE